MSLVVAVRYLAEFAADSLRPFDPSREEAADLFERLPAVKRLRADDAATADEVLHLVLGRFASAEPPAVPGVDFLPKPKCNGNCIADNSGAVVVEDLCCPLHGVEAVES